MPVICSTRLMSDDFSALRAVCVKARTHSYINAGT